MNLTLDGIPDAHRIDPAHARQWRVQASGFHTIVVATCQQEAGLLGLLWIAHAQGRTRVDLTVRVHVREATPGDVDTWTSIRTQQAELELRTR